MTHRTKPQLAYWQRIVPWNFRTCLLIILWAAPVQGGQVILNEIMARSSQRALIREGPSAPPRVGTGPAWFDMGFDARDWAVGNAPFGYGFSGIRTHILAMLQPQTPSVYLRGEFELTQAQLDAGLQLDIRYTDGVVVYVNGREAVRRRMGPPGMYIYGDQTAFTANPFAPAETLDLTNALPRVGRNVITLQVHSVFVANTAFLIDPKLRVRGEGQPWLIGPGDPWRYFIGRIEPSGGVFDPQTLSSLAGDNDFSDWVELYNAGVVPVSLEGWSLTDTAALPRKWLFPPVTIEAGGYLLVLCDGLDRVEKYLHANFSLDQAGEYVGLYDAAGTVAAEFAPAYPRQVLHYSYGREGYSGRHGYLADPTPGGPNSEQVFWGIATSPQLDPSPGFYEEDTEVHLSCRTPGAIIRYTLDGTDPTETVGSTYEGPILLSTNTVVRARAFRAGWIASSIRTGTYLLKAPPALRTLRAVALSGDERLTFYQPEGVTAIVGGQFVDEVWQATGPDDYNMALIQGRAVERPASLELIYPDGYTQIDCGVRLAASPFSRPRMTMLGLENEIWNSGWQNKPSFSLFFRSEYGANQLDWPVFPGSAVDSFDSLRLRAGKNDWANPFIVDEVVRRLFLAMGHVSSRGVLCNLFINGRFKSYFNLVERYREPFFQSWYDTNQPWDVRAGDVIEAGDTVQWDLDFSFVRTNDLSEPSVYAEAARRFDLVNLADYALLNAYCGMSDWPGNNFYLARQRGTNGIWRFYVWDAEGGIGYKPVNYGSFELDLIGLPPFSALPSDTIPILFGSCYRNLEFRVLVGDRIQKHFFRDGMLTFAKAMAAYDQLRLELEPMMNFVRGQSVHLGYVQAWMQDRPAHVLAEARSFGMWPEVSAPSFNQEGGSIVPGFVLELLAPDEAGLIYYTLDGSDPRLPGGGIGGALYLGPVPLTSSTTVKARVRLGDQWSPLAEAEFNFPIPSSLTITEIHYNPLDQDDVPGSSFEFLEIQNTGSEAVDLTDVGLTVGVQYQFPDGAVLGPGAFVVLVSDPAAFATRYPGVAIAGAYTGRLDNSGERVTLSWRQTNVLFTVRYDDNLPWPTSADGLGFSLVPWTTAAQHLSPEDPVYWRSSAAVGGSPGAEDALTPIQPVLINEVLARPLTATGWRIEFHNPSDTPVNLQGWYLTDDESFPFKFRFSNRPISARGFALLTEAAVDEVPEAIRPKVVPGGGRLMLLSASGEMLPSGYSHTIDYGAAAPGDALGRHRNSEGMEEFVAQVGNSLNRSNSAPRVGKLVLAEVMYDPPPGQQQFIELYNNSDSTLSLFSSNDASLTWRVEGIGFQFPSGTVLAPRESFLLVGDDPAVFRSQNDLPATVRVLGPWSGQLQRGGERLRLLQPDFVAGENGAQLVWIAVDQVSYGNNAPWPEEAAGLGASIARIHLSGYGNEPTNWTAAVPTPGRASTFNGQILPSLYITSSHNGLAKAGEAVTLNLIPIDFVPQGAVSLISDGVTLAQTDQAPYTIEWQAATGTHSFLGLAINANGSTVESAGFELRVVAADTVTAAFITSNSVWKFLDDGRAPLNGWQTLHHDDSAWGQGPAPLGYGKGNEATAVQPGLDPEFRATYFRQRFVAPSGVAWRNLVCRGTVNDGVVVYLNGEEIFSLGVPKGAIDPQTPSSGNGSDLAFARELEPWRILSGTNVLAAEVHRAAGDDNDLSFELELTAELTAVEPAIVGQPEDLILQEGSIGVLNVQALGQPLAYHWRRDTGETLFGGAFLLLEDILPEAAGGYFVVVSNSVSTVTSRTAAVTVIVPDDDSDGLPNWWEILYGLNPNDPTDAGLDPDLDGLTNLEEFENGTDPNHSDLNLVLTLVLTEGRITGVKLQFNVPSQLRYSLLHLPDLDQNTWSVLEVYEPQPASRSVHYEASLIGGSGFFRLQPSRP